MASSVFNDTYVSTDLVEDANGGYMQPDNIVQFKAIANKTDQASDSSPSHQPQDQLRYFNNRTAHHNKHVDAKAIDTSLSKLAISEEIGGKIHEYEELPPSRYGHNDYLTTTEFPISEQFAGGFPRADVSGQKKRSNPLYETSKSFESKQSVDSIISRTSSTPMSRCVFVWIGVLLVIAVAALVVAAIGLSTGRNMQYVNMQSTDVTTTVKELQSQVRELLNDNRLLHIQIKSLLDLIGGSNTSGSTLSGLSNSSDIISTLTTQVNQLLSTSSMQSEQLRSLSQRTTGFNASLDGLASKVQVQGASFADQLSQLGANLTDRINAVSKMAGPPGPPGAGNLSMCLHQMTSRGESASKLETFSNVIDMTATIMQPYVVTGLTCTTIGGTQAFLTYNQYFPEQYRCVCRGQVNSTYSDRQCIVHYWLCPRVS